MTGFVTLPEAPAFVLQNATVPAICLKDAAGLTAREGLVAADITIENGKVGAITAPGTAAAALLASAGVGEDNSLLLPMAGDRAPGMSAIKKMNDRAQSA